MIGYFVVAAVSASVSFFIGGAMAGGKVRDLEARQLATEELVIDLSRTLRAVRDLVAHQQPGNSQSEVLHLTDAMLNEAEHITRG